MARLTAPILDSGDNIGGEVIGGEDEVYSGGPSAPAATTLSLGTSAMGKRRVIRLAGKEGLLGRVAVAEQSESELQALSPSGLTSTAGAKRAALSLWAPHVMGP